MQWLIESGLTSIELSKAERWKRSIERSFFAGYINHNFRLPITCWNIHYVHNSRCTLQQKTQEAMILVPWFNFVYTLFVPKQSWHSILLCHYWNKKFNKVVTIIMSPDRLKVKFSKWVTHRGDRRVMRWARRGEDEKNFDCHLKS